MFYKHGLEIHFKYGSNHETIPQNKSYKNLNLMFSLISLCLIVIVFYLFRDCLKFDSHEYEDILLC